MQILKEKNAKLTKDIFIKKSIANNNNIKEYRKRMAFRFRFIKAENKNVNSEDNNNSKTYSHRLLTNKMINMSKSIPDFIMQNIRKFNIDKSSRNKSELNNNQTNQVNFATDKINKNTKEKEVEDMKRLSFDKNKVIMVDNTKSKSCIEMKLLNKCKLHYNKFNYLKYLYKSPNLSCNNNYDTPQKKNNIMERTQHTLDEPKKLNSINYRNNLDSPSDFSSFNEIRLINSNRNNMMKSNYKIKKNIIYPNQKIKIFKKNNTQHFFQLSSLLQ